MARTHRVTTVALLVCLLGGPWGGILFAADEPSSQGIPQPAAHTPFTFTDDLFAVDRTAAVVRAQAWQGRFDFVPADSTLLAQRGYRHRGGGRDNGGSAAAIIIGAAAAIAGGAILVYANRPDCRFERADGCGYGTKVAGGAVLSAGLVSVIVGAVTWR
jgi:hypothetical protein